LNNRHALFAFVNSNWKNKFERHFAGMYSILNALKHGLLNKMFFNYIITFKACPLCRQSFNIKDIESFIEKKE